MKRKVRIIVAGSRTFKNYDELKDLLDGITCVLGDVEIISGHAYGADRLGERYAKEHNLKCTIFPAQWSSYGKRAGYIRNVQMAEYAQQDGCIAMLVAFWDGVSNGTKNMVNIAVKRGIQVHVTTYRSDESNG